MADIAYNFVILARQLAAHNCFRKAFAMYMCAFERHPNSKGRYENEFRVLLLKLNEELATTNNKADIFANFEMAIKVFPVSIDILNDIGKYLYRYGYFSEALCHFEKALNIDNSFVSIEKNLNIAKSFLLPRGHFRILNDKIRNEAYRRAIQSCVTPATDSVIDIDASTGLLALYANACNPTAITACESSTTLARLAEYVVQDNNAQDVVIVNKPSVLLSHTDIYGTRSVLLTDLIDSALFGEYILQSLCHAWENLLYQGSRVIPGRAEYFIVGVKCDELIKKYQLCNAAKSVLNISKMNVHVTTYFGETYYSDDVHLYKNLKYMTSPKSLLKIDFNDYYDVHEKLHAQKLYSAELTATTDGEINAIIGYFDLHLTNNITITTDPRCEWRANAWQQAIFFDLIPKNMRQNDSTNIEFLTFGGRLATRSQTSNPNVYPIRRISPDTLTFLNDTEYMKMINGCLGTVCVYIGQTVDMSLVDIVDLCPFPLFGMQMIKRGANSVLCHAKTTEDEAFIKTVLQANGIAEDKVTILLSEYWSHELLKEKKFHIIFTNYLDLNGDIDVRRKRVAQHLKEAHLMKGGLFLPYQVSLIGQLISSKWLEINNRVLDENVDEYKIAEHVNKYQVSQAIYVDLARLEYTPLSEEFVVAECCNLMKSDMLSIPVTQDGECTAILCWYKLRLMDNWGEITMDRSNSFVEATAFLDTANKTIFKDDEVTVIRCVDPDGSYKLVLDV